MLSEKELWQLRQAALQTLRDQATIFTPTEVSDGSLGTKIEWVEGATIPCRVSERSTAREVVIGGKVASTGTHNLRLPYGTEVNESDRVRVITSGRTRRFDVTRVLESSFATVTSLECQEVRDG